MSEAGTAQPPENFVGPLKKINLPEMKRLANAFDIPTVHPNRKGKTKTVLQSEIQAYIDANEGTLVLDPRFAGLLMYRPNAIERGAAKTSADKDIEEDTAIVAAATGSNKPSG